MQLKWWHYVLFAVGVAFWAIGHALRDDTREVKREGRFDA